MRPTPTKGFSTNNHEKRVKKYCSDLTFLFQAQYLQILYGFMISIINVKQISQHKKSHIGFKIVYNLTHCFTRIYYIFAVLLSHVFCSSASHLSKRAINLINVSLVVIVKQQSQRRKKHNTKDIMTDRKNMIDENSIHEHKVRITK